MSHRAHYEGVHVQRNLCIPTVRGRLHRLVRLFVIHAFDRSDCRLDGDWIKCE